MRILQVTASSLPGGGPEHLWQLVRHLPRDMDCFIAAPRREPYWPRFAAAVGLERLFELPERAFSLLALARLARWARRQGIEIIHSHGKGAGLYGRPAALLAGARSIHTFHGIHLGYRSPLRQCYIQAERLLCAMSRACIAVSPGEAEEARALGFGRGKIALIPNGVVVPARVCPRPGRPFKLVQFSRFDPLQKNSLWLLTLARALRAAGRLEECRFVLVGDGPQREILQQALAVEGLDCADFAGFRPDPRSFLGDAGCYISTSRWEGLPLAVLEAQAEGIPCLVTDVVGNRDAVEDNVSGWLYPLDDAQAAVARICRLMDDQALWQRMSQAAHARAARLFGVERMAARVAACYRQTTEARRPPRE